MTRWILLADNFDNPDGEALRDILVRMRAKVIDGECPYRILVECPEGKGEEVKLDTTNWTIHPIVEYRMMTNG